MPVTNSRDSSSSNVGKRDMQVLGTTDSSNETRIRSAYIRWCQKYNKTPDDLRFLTFLSNFLAMEEYSRENNKEMNLNRYADCTEEEYISIMSGSVISPKLAADPTSNATVTAAVEMKLKKEPGELSVAESFQWHDVSCFY